MEEDNKITPWKFIIQHWKLIALVFLFFPIIINALTFIPNFQVFDKPNSWTEVWAEYGGALLSAGIALVILYKQQKQNHEENEANRKQNELQNKLNLNLQINALKYQQKYNWYFELKHALTDLNIACDTNTIQLIRNDIIDYYELTDINEIDKAKSEIEKSINNCFNKINSCNSSFICMLNKEERKELDDKLESLRKYVCYYLNILNNLKGVIIIFDNPDVKTMSIDEIEFIIKFISESKKIEHENFDEDNKLAQKIILKEYLEKYEYDFNGNFSDILTSMFNDFQNKVVSTYKIIDDILQFEREKIDNLLDVEEIKKNLNAN